MKNTMNALTALHALQNNGLEKMMYRLSLSGRELFHSNMLSYLLEETDYGLGEAIANHFIHNGFGVQPINWCGRCLNQNSEIRVLREKENLDLIVMIKPVANNQCQCGAETFSTNLNCYLLIIENKFKSLPDNCQLDEYNQKIAKRIIDIKAGKSSGIRQAKNDTFNKYWKEWQDDSEYGGHDETDASSNGNSCNFTNINIQEYILMPYDVKPPTLSNSISIFQPVMPWKSIFYEDLVNIIGQHITHQNPIKAYSLITDKIINVIKSAIDDIYTTTFFCLNKVRPHSRILRINDLVEKWRYAALKFEWDEEIRKKLNNLSSNSKQSCKYLGTYSPCNAYEVDIYSESSFSRSTGITGVEWHPKVLKDGQYKESMFYFGLQLQSNQLKLYVCFEPSAPNNKSKSKLQDEQFAVNILEKLVNAIPLNFLGLRGKKFPSKPPVLLSYFMRSGYKQIISSQNKNQAWFFYVQTDLLDPNNAFHNLNVTDLGQKLSCLTLGTITCSLLQEVESAFNQRNQ